MVEQRFAFGPFVLDLEAGTLVRQGVPVPIGYRGLRLLSAMVKRQGEIVTKSDLIRRGLARHCGRGSEPHRSDRLAQEAPRPIG